MHKFLKLGKYTINPSAIAYIDWDFQFKYTAGDELIHQVRVYLLTQECGDSIFLSFEVDSPEAKALYKYFYEPDIGYDLLLLYSQEEQDKEWLESRVQYGTQRLIKINKPRIKPRLRCLEQEEHG